MDVEELFRKHTFVELKDIEKKLRTDVERKKEELRDLVAVRYRDLLDAADQIKGMHVAITNVTEELNVCKTAEVIWNAGSVNAGSVNEGTAVLSRRETLANSSLNAPPTSLDNLLTTAPEIIFKALDNNDPLTGALVFALVRNMVWQNNAENGSEEENPKWEFLRIFGGFILQNVQTQFERITYTPKELVGYFAAVGVLQSVSTRRETLKEFLFSRNEIILNFLTFSSSEMPTKKSLRLLLTSILETFRGVHDIFSDSEEVGEYLQKRAKTVEKEVFYENEEMFVLLKSIISACVIDPKDPEDPSDPRDLDDFQHAKQALSVWLEKTVIPEVAEHLVTALNCVPSISAVAEVSRAVAAALAEESKKTPSLAKIEHDLGLSAGGVVDLIRNSVRERFSALVRGRTKAALKAVAQQLDAFDKELDAFGPSQEMLFGASQEETSSPRRKFVSSLQGIESSAERTPTRTKYPSIKSGSWKTATTASGSAIAQISSELTKLREEIRHTDNKLDSADSHPVAWMQDDALSAYSEMVRAIFPLLQTRLGKKDLPAHHSIFAFISELSSLNVFTLNDPPPTLVESTGSSEVAEVAEFSEFSELVERELDGCVQLIFNDWLSSTLTAWKQTTLERLKQNQDLVRWCLDTPPFQSNVVEEVNEAGEGVQYTVTVPARASVTSQVALQSLHDALLAFTVGTRGTRETQGTQGTRGTRGRNLVTDAATRQIFLAVVQCYTEYVEGGLSPGTTKNQALQLIFDLKVVVAFGKRRRALPPAIVQTVQKLIEKVAAFVDPIDFHAQLPFLERNVVAYVASVQNLYFSLTFSESSGGGGGGGGDGGSGSVLLESSSTVDSHSADSPKSVAPSNVLQSKAAWFSHSQADAALFSKI